MAKVKQKKCKQCGSLFTPYLSTKKCCSIDCEILHGKAFIVTKKKKEKVAQRKKDRRRLQELQPRSYWYGRLEKLVNQYVLWRDRNEPCCTCGTVTEGIKYDAGHFFTKAARSDIRFELTNIHKQCSQKCNVYGSGMRNEYEKFIVKKYGQKHLEWLKEVKPPLKEQFPNWQDIEAEIVRYRKILRDVGLKPKT